MTTTRSRAAERPRRGAGTLRPASVLVTTGAVAFALALAGCAGPDASAGESPAPATSLSSAPAVPTTTESIEPPALGLAPAGVTIPKIEVQASLIDLGIDAEGGMEVPADFDEVGWFTGGGMPGGRGPTVIAAHVDSPTGPAAFFRLRELAVGDSVEVTDAAGVIHRYTVSEVADYPKAEFPTARVFGATTTDELRLVTCGGVFDQEASSYVDNRVVYAVRAGA